MSELNPTGVISDRQADGGRAPVPAPLQTPRDIALLGNVEVTITVELGRTQMAIRDVLKLRHGSVIELEKLTGQPVDLLVNNTLMARGEVIVINGRFGFRVTRFFTKEE